VGNSVAGIYDQDVTPPSLGDNLASYLERLTLVVIDVHRDPLSGADDPHTRGWLGVVDNSIAIKADRLAFQKGRLVIVWHENSTRFVSWMPLPAMAVLSLLGVGAKPMEAKLQGTARCFVLPFFRTSTLG
jgi:hypothetical protein